MLRKLSKTMAIFAVVMVMAVSVLSVNAFAATPNSIDDYWSLVVGYGNNPWFGVVKGLVNVEDNGITFRCTSYNNAGFSEFHAYGQIANSALRADYARGAILDHVNDDGTDSFRRGWYDINGGGDVMYYVQANSYTLGVGQYIYGYAR